MRRFAMWFGIALVLTVALSASMTAGLQAARCASRTSLRLLARTLVSPAAAQEVLEFKPVPAESTSKLEQIKPPRRRGTLAVPPVTPPPPTLPAPSAPTAPGAPGTISLGKSGNIMRVGADIHIETDQVVVGDVMAVGGDITVDGHVEGDVVAMGGDVFLHNGGRVDGDVVCMGGELHEDEGSVIGGQRVTASRHGKLARIRNREAREEAHGITGSIVWLLISLGIAWAFSGLAPGRTGRALETLKREPGASAVTGILAAMLTLPSIVALCLLVALLCITIIGIPLAIGALFGYFMFLGVLWMWGFVIGSAAIGERWARPRPASTIGTATGAPVGAASAAVAASPDRSGLTRAALSGVLLISGVGLVASILHRPGLGAIGGLLTLIRVLSWIAFSGVTLAGAGAWLRAEFKAGTLSRLWGRRRAAATAPAAVSATAEAGSPSGVTTPPAEPPVTPAGA
jgi:hypothetical protein